MGTIVTATCCNTIASLNLAILLTQFFFFFLNKFEVKKVNPPMLLPTNCSSVFNHFVALALKGSRSVIPTIDAEYDMGNGMD